MRLFLVRHGVDEDQSEFAMTGKKDSERPLTLEGIKKLKRVSKGLKTQVDHLDLIISSPYKRALQTAEVLKMKFKDSQSMISRALEPGRSPAQSIELLSALGFGLDTVAWVGHEPLMGYLLSVLLTGKELGFFGFKKGGIACIEFVEKPASSKGLLLWAMEPKMISCLGD